MMNKYILTLVTSFTLSFQSFATEQGLLKSQDFKVSAELAVQMQDWSSAEHYYLQHSLSALEAKDPQGAYSSFNDYLKSAAQTENKDTENQLSNYRLYLRKGGTSDNALDLAIIQFLQTKKNYQNAEKYLKLFKPADKKESESALALQAEVAVHLNNRAQAIQIYQELIKSSEAKSTEVPLYSEKLLLLFIAQASWEEAQSTLVAQFPQGEAKRTYYEFYILLAQKKYTEALQKFADFNKEGFPLAKMPLVHNSLLKLQWSLRANGQSQDALAVIDKLIEISSEEFDKLKVIKADTLLESKNYDLALSEYREFLSDKQEPFWQAEVMLNVAHLLSRSKSPEQETEALEFYKKSFELAKEENKNSLAYQASLQIARALQELKRSEEAIKQYTIAASVSNDANEKAIAYCLAGQLCTELGIQYNDKKEFAKATVHFRKAMEIDSKLQTQALLHYAFNMRAAGLHQNALEAFTKLRMTDFNAPERIYFQGLSLIDSGQVLKGLDQLISVAKKYPKDNHAHSSLLFALKASTFKLTGKNRQNYSEKILSQYAKLPKSEKDQAVFLHLKALNAWYKNDDQEAIQLWQVFSSEYPDHPLAIEVQLWQAFTYYKAKNFDKALELYEFIEKTYPNNVLIYHALYKQAKIYFEEKDFKNSSEVANKFIKQFEQTLTKNSKEDSLAQAHFLIAQGAEATRKYAQAVKQLQSAVDLSLKNKNLQALSLAKLADSTYLGAFQDSSNVISQLELAADTYSKLAQKSQGAIKIQALYKQALCYSKMSENNDEAIAKTKATEKAAQLLSTVVFELDNAEKSSPYYFSRACLNLGQIFIKNDQILSAKAVYKKLIEAQIPGSRDAEIILRKLNINTK